MADATDRQLELRRLLRAYRRGLIDEEVFAEQLREIGLGNGGAPAAEAPAAGARLYRVKERTFASEREMLLHFLDEFRAGETFGGVVLSLWLEVARDAALRGGLRVACEREAMHGRLLAARLAELGGRPQATLPEALREAARARLGARDVPDRDKLAEFLSRLPDAEAAVAPIREVIAQIEEDCETRALLEAIVADEIATVGWLHEAARRLGVSVAPKETDAGRAGL